MGRFSAVESGSAVIFPDPEPAVLLKADPDPTAFLTRIRKFSCTYIMYSVHCVRIILGGGRDGFRHTGTIF